jgi:hypothetical protein
VGDEGWCCSANACVRAGGVGNLPAACLTMGCYPALLARRSGRGLAMPRPVCAHSPKYLARLENEDMRSRGTAYLRPLRAAACRAVRDARAGSSSAAAAVRAPAWAGRGTDRCGRLHNPAQSVGESLVLAHLWL